MQGELSLTDLQRANFGGVLPNEFREEFNNLQDVGDWVIQGTGNYSYSVDGNTAGASYLRMTLDPTDPTASLVLYGGPSKICKTPYRVGFAVTYSRRSPYQLTWFGLIGATRDSTPDWNTNIPKTFSLNATGGVVVLSNVATVTTTTNHGLKVGDRVVLSGFSDPRVNFSQVVSNTPTPTTFTLSFTFTNGTYGTTGTVTFYDSGLGAGSNHLVHTVDGTSGNAAIVNSNSENVANLVQVWNPGNTWDTSTIPNYYTNYNTSYTYAHQPKFVEEFINEREWMGWILSAVDSTGGQTSTISRDQAVPFFRKAGALPVAQITNQINTPIPLPITVAAKSASTTATLTIPNHGLTTSDVILIYGIRDQTNFANQTTGTAVASVVNSNQITVVFGASATATSYGGVVVRASANTTSTVSNSSAQSTSVTTAGRLSVTFAASPGTPIVGESIYLAGVVDSTNTRQASIEGLWRVASYNGTTFVLELDPLKGQVPATFANIGGMYVYAPDMRIHSVRAHTHSRLAVEVESGRAHARAQNSIPVAINANLASNQSTNISQLNGGTAGTVTDNGGTNRALEVIQMSPVSSNDVTSAARTGSGNSGVINSAIGTTGISALINVTAASGTTPTLDITLEESPDNGTTWYKVWDLPRITGVAVMPVPNIMVNGRRRWVWVIGGTTPSFTFTITSMNANQSKAVKQLIDRTINPNTLNSSTPSINIAGCPIVTMQVSTGAGATVNPQYSFQLSHDNVNWFTPGGGGTIPPSTNQFAASTNYTAHWARISITSAGTGATQNFVVLNASEA